MTRDLIIDDALHWIKDRIGNGVINVENSAFGKWVIGNGQGIGQRQ
ncbi:hypothetical protein [Vulcanisaeta distributa]|uniref:Uncharacterized protein n=1 Tax=Vulcanisaeta distributa (strain DSM 14429 / JCM 11212 / NBRC 100878 / IC-017) TaxID=572478 RepID=E1QVD0_VULDI|nr:hypothetical protein [Vulcanisaeta distributa]ADN50057.1 hypothetical protein Vdis_0662 [Vulcanisaeta distributa DSM 14429]